MAPLNDDERASFHSTIQPLVPILMESDNYGQAAFVQELLYALENSNDSEFLLKIVSNSMWGGSGAVWEVYIPIQEKYREFAMNILDLLRTMDSAGIHRAGLEQIKSIFKSISK